MFLPLSAFPLVYISLNQPAAPCLCCPSASLVTVGRTMLTSHSLCNSINSEQAELLFFQQPLRSNGSFKPAHLSCESVCVTAAACAYASKHVCMYVWYNYPEDCVRERVIKGHREWERNTAVTQGWRADVPPPNTHTQKIAQNKQLHWLAKVSCDAFKHIFLIREFDSPCAIMLQALRCCVTLKYCTSMHFH